MIESNPDDMVENWHVRLRRILVQYFSEEELQTICYDLRVDYDELPGDSKTQKAVSLIIHLTRQDKVEQLITICSQERPNVPWDDLRAAAMQNPLLVEELPDQPGRATPRPVPGSAVRFSTPVMVVFLAVFVLVVAGGIGLAFWNSQNSPGQNETPIPPVTSMAAVETPINSALATETAVSPNRLLLSDNFEQGQTLNWQSSNPATTPSVVALPDGNQALLLTHGTEAFYTPAWEWPTSNYRLEADVMVNDLASDTSIGWHARVQNPAASGFCRGYRAEIGPEHTAIHVISAVNCSSTWEYDTLDYGAFQLEVGRWYHLRLDVKDDQLQFFVDNILLNVTTDRQNSYPNGGIGLMVFQSAETYADNVVVTTLANNP